MRLSIITGMVLLSGFTTFAEPEIKGSASELTQFLTAIPKTVRITGEAEIRVPARRAILSLRVITESKSLQEALRNNLEIRGKLTDYLKNLGMPAERIQASKFSSTPKFGMFGEKAKSYRVENVMRISVQDEKEFQAASGAVDKWAEVQFDGVEFEYADKEQQKQNAVARACENAADRMKIYEEKIGMKLVPASFSEGEVEKRNATPANYAASRPETYDRSVSSGWGSSSAPVTEESASSFGEIVYTAKVSVEYTVQPK